MPFSFSLKLPWLKDIHSWIRFWKTESEDCNRELDSPWCYNDSPACLMFFLASVRWEVWLLDWQNDRGKWGIRDPCWKPALTSIARAPLQSKAELQGLWSFTRSYYDVETWKAASKQPVQKELLDAYGPLKILGWAKKRNIKMKPRWG